MCDLRSILPHDGTTSVVTSVPVPTLVLPAVATLALAGCGFDVVDVDVREDTDHRPIDAARLGSPAATTRTDDGRVRLAFDRAPTAVSAERGDGATAFRIPDLDVHTDPSAGRRVTARSATVRSTSDTGRADPRPLPGLWPGVHARGRMLAVPNPESLRRLVAIIIAAAAAPGLAHAAFSVIDRAATVHAGADRGTAFQVAEPDRPTTTPYGLPVADTEQVGWSDTHHTYPATDLFHECGALVVSPVWGTVLHVRRVDAWNPRIDDPATRGGRSVAILGFDGVRYYFAHLDTIVDDFAVGDEVALGQALGTMGTTGRSSACHLHFGISPPCPDTEWAVRRGVVWPYPYLDAWKRGEQLSPVDEVDAWLAANPTACAHAAERRSALGR